MTAPAIRATNSSAPDAPGNGQQRPAAPPPSPKVQALSTALELAKIRGTAGGPGERLTDVNQLISDAEAIAAFIGPSSPSPSGAFGQPR